MTLAFQDPKVENANLTYEPKYLKRFVLTFKSHLDSPEQAVSVGVLTFSANGKWPNFSSSNLPRTGTSSVTLAPSSPLSSLHETSTKNDSLPNRIGGARYMADQIVLSRPPNSAAKATIRPRSRRAFGGREDLLHSSLLASCSSSSLPQAVITS